MCYCLWKSKPLKQAKIEINSVNCQETNEYQIDKDKNEIFQENQYHINRYSDSENLMKEGTDTVGSLFYIICKSCLTYEIFEKWKKYIDDVLIDTNTAYKDMVFE